MKLKNCWLIIFIAVGRFYNYKVAKKECYLNFSSLLRLRKRPGGGPKEVFGEQKGSLT